MKCVTFAASGECSQAATSLSRNLHWRPIFMAGISLHSAHRHSVRVETPSHFDTAEVLSRGSRVLDFSIGLSLYVEYPVCPAIQLPVYNLLSTMRKIILLTALAAGVLCAQPNPYRTVEHWFQLPEERKMGSTSAVAVAANGHVWVAERC